MVMHVTPELEVLGSNLGGVGTQYPRRQGVCDPASRKGCCEGQVGITVTLDFGVRPSTLPLPLPIVDRSTQHPHPPLQVPPPCVSYALVQATVGVGIVIIVYVI